MLIKASYTLTSPEVTEARSRYELNRSKAHGYKGDIPFDVLWDLFQSGRSCAEIAAMHGVTRQCIHLKYTSYFQFFFGEKVNPASIRHKKRKLEKRKHACQSIELRTIQASLEAGIVLTPELRNPRKKSKVISFCRINGEVCKIYRVTNVIYPKKSQPQRYASYEICLPKIECTHLCILILDLPAEEFIYVYPIPSELLREKITEKRGRKNLVIYIPYGHPATYSRAFDVLKYKKCVRRADLPESI